MPERMIWDDTQQKMIPLGVAKGEMVKIAVDSALAEALRGFATEDGYNFSGVSYVTEKDKDGKTKTDASGKPIYVQEDGKPKKVTVEISTAKVNSAISQYATIAIKKLIEARQSVQS